MNREKFTEEGLKMKGWMGGKGDVKWMDVCMYVVGSKNGKGEKKWNDRTNFRNLLILFYLILIFFFFVN